MINKQGLWFLTLFSLILVLSIYYITMPNELFLTNNNSNAETTTNNNKEEEVNLEVTESSFINSLKVDLQSEREELMTTLEETMNSSKTTTEEKNEAYEKIKELNNTKGLEDQITKKLKNELKLNAFVKIDNNDISVVVDKKEHDVSLANQIMKLVQTNFTESMNISVKFAS